MITSQPFSYAHGIELGARSQARLKGSRWERLNLPPHLVKPWGLYVLDVHDRRKKPRYVLWRGPKARIASMSDADRLEDRRLWNGELKELLAGGELDCSECGMPIPRGKHLLAGSHAVCSQTCGQRLCGISTAL